jgi:multiple sugar transport system substrate-binding protein
MKLGRISVFALVLVSALLTGCQTAPAASENISFMVFGDPAELAAYQLLVDAFKTAHPEIQVELIHIPSQSDYRKRIAADIAAGTPADVVLINYRRLAGLANTGGLQALDEYLAKSKTIKPDDFFPQAFDAFKWNDKQICIPQNISSLVVYYNQDLFDQAGVKYPAADWTWDDFLAAAQALTQDRDGDGATDQFGAGIEPVLLRLAPFIWQAGGEVVDSEVTPSTLFLTLPESQAAGEFFFSLQTQYHVVPNAEEEAAEGSESRFINGRTAMYFNSRRVVTTLRESAQFNWDVAALPRNKNAATVLHADGYCIPSAARNKDAAWVFIEYANSVEGQTIIAATGRTVPSLITVANSPAFLDPNARPANSQVFLDVIPTIRALPLFPTWPEIEEIADEEVERGFYGQTDAVTALSTAEQRTRALFYETK